MKRFAGSLYSWTDSYFTQIGHNEFQPSYSPKKIDLCYKAHVPSHYTEMMSISQLRLDKELTYKFSQVATGPYHTLFLTEQGMVLGSGEEKYNKRGHSSPTYLLDRVAGLSGLIIRQVSCGLDHSLALTNTGDVYSWGYGGMGEKFVKSLFFQDPYSPLGQNVTQNFAVPTKIESLENVLQIEAGYHHSLALTRTGDLFVFGDNFYGQLGTSQAFALKPVLLKIGSIKKIAACRNFSAALSHTGEVYVWGFNHYGQLGVEEEIIQKPKLVETGCIDLEAGEGSVVLLFDGFVKIAGMKKYKKFERVQIEEKPSQFAAGDCFVAFVDRFGEVWNIGGVFGGKRRYSFMKEPELKFTKVERGFFPGRVKGLYGKYSYHVAILED